MNDQAGTTLANAFANLVDQYRDWLTVERRLAPGTIKYYVREARLFLAGRDGLDLPSLTLGDVTEYVVRECRHRSVASAARKFVVALRSLLRYLHLEGLTNRELAPAVPAPTSWRGTWLPRGLSDNELAVLLASSDNSTAIGRRDHAIVVMLARLGLRAGEVAALSLDDLDWVQGEIVVHGNKGNHTERLPLPVDVGEALVAYLRDGRPKTTCRAVFLRANGTAGLSAAGVGDVVQRAVARAGLAPRSAQRLRHSAGTALLRAGGSLDEVGQVLRQRSSQITSHYAKVDFARLRTLALPWPERVA